MRFLLIFGSLSRILVSGEWDCCQRPGLLCRSIWGEKGRETSETPSGGRARRPVRKLSQWKETWPGRRQVYRQYDSSGYIGMDVLACENEVMTSGRRLCCAPPLKEVSQRQHQLAAEVAQIPH